MVPRQFTLQNSRGESLNLLDQNGPQLSSIDLCGIMFFEPDGLGYEESEDWLQLGTAFRPVNITQAQRTISGKMYFLGEDKAYERYFNFVRFIRQTPLTLIYKAYDTFYIDVRVQSLEKTELTKYGVLECKIKFMALGPFYKRVFLYYTPPKKTVEEPDKLVSHLNVYFKDDEGDDIVLGKPNYNEFYDYVYDDVYPYENRNSISTRVMNDVLDSSPVRLYIYGPCVNPTWSHYVDDDLVESGKYNGTIDDGRILVVDSISVPYRIVETGEYAHTSEDRYGGCDFSTERFMFISQGNNRFSVSHEGPDPNVKFRIEMREYYESV